MAKSLYEFEHLSNDSSDQPGNKLHDSGKFKGKD